MTKRILKSKSHKPEIGPSLAITETELLSSIRQAAKDCGWLIYRAQFSMYSSRGWPDLFMVRNGQALAWELKGAKGKPTEAQIEWIEALQTVPGVDARVVYPQDLETAYKALVTGLWSVAA
mgnify:CR=1 FL=1